MLTELYKPKQDNPMALAIFMSGSGSNATKIIDRYFDLLGLGQVNFKPVVIFTDDAESNAQKISDKYASEKNVVIPVVCNPLISKLIEDREAYDLEQVEMLRKYDVDVIALAGYDWIVTPVICDSFLIVNVHPGDLRVKGDNGKRSYIGLGWVPSAKAILDGQKNVYTSVHLVSSELDGGALLAVSAPQSVPETVLNLEKHDLLGGASSLREVMNFVRANPNMPQEEIANKFPIYGFAKECQERLKIYGDWIEFPDVIENLAAGLYREDESGEIYFKDKTIPEGIIRRGE